VVKTDWIEVRFWMWIERNY